MEFNKVNVQTAVKDVTNNEFLGDWLGVPWKRRVESEYDEDEAGRLEEYVDYFVDHDPLASWRRVIISLGWLNDNKSAEKIQHLAEPLAGEGR